MWLDQINMCFFLSALFIIVFCPVFYQAISYTHAHMEPPMNPVADLPRADLTNPRCMCHAIWRNLTPFACPPQYIFLPCWECYDFTATIAHEVGHVLGFHHPDTKPELNLKADIRMSNQTCISPLDFVKLEAR